MPHVPDPRRLIRHIAPFQLRHQPLPSESLQCSVDTNCEYIVLSPPPLQEDYAIEIAALFPSLFWLAFLHLIVFSLFITSFNLPLLRYSQLKEGHPTLGAAVIAFFIEEPLNGTCVSKNVAAFYDFDGAFVLAGLLYADGAFCIRRVVLRDDVKSGWFGSGPKRGRG